jgi:hypothetical protein
MRMRICICILQLHIYIYMRARAYAWRRAYIYILIRTRARMDCWSSCACVFLAHAIASFISHAYWSGRVHVYSTFSANAIGCHIFSFKCQTIDHNGHDQEEQKCEKTKHGVALFCLGSFCGLAIRCYRRRCRFDDWVGQEHERETTKGHHTHVHVRQARYELVLVQRLERDPAATMPCFVQLSQKIENIWDTDRQTDRQADRQTDRQTDTHTHYTQRERERESEEEGKKKKKKKQKKKKKKKHHLNVRNVGSGQDESQTR